MLVPQQEVFEGPQPMEGEAFLRCYLFFFWVYFDWKFNLLPHNLWLYAK
jgi:hypothetical protein